MSDDLYSEGLMNRAVDSERGVEVSFPTRGRCIQAMWRCYKRRLADRQMMFEINLGDRDPNDISPSEKRLMMRSEYDCLMFSYSEVDGTWWLRIERIDPDSWQDRVREL